MMEILQRIPKNITLSPTMAEKKEWVAAAAMAAGAVASSLFGAAKARKAARAAEKQRTYRKNAEQAWFNKEYNTDYLDTRAGQNLMRRAQEVQDSYIRKADGAAAVGGGTAAATAMAKETANRSMGDTIANIAAQDTTRKQRVADQHLANVQSLSQEQQAAEQAKAQATSDAAQGMSNSLMSGAVTQMGSDLNKAKSMSSNTLSASAPRVDSTEIARAGKAAPNPLRGVGKPSGGLNGLGEDPLELATGVHHNGKVYKGTYA